MVCCQNKITSLERSVQGKPRRLYDFNTNMIAIKPPDALGSLWSNFKIIRLKYGSDVSMSCLTLRLNYLHAAEFYWSHRLYTIANSTDLECRLRLYSYAVHYSINEVWLGERYLTKQRYSKIPPNLIPIGGMEPWLNVLLPIFYEEVLRSMRSRAANTGAKKLAHIISRDRHFIEPFQTPTTSC
jgi:hypothetical protein